MKTITQFITLNYNNQAQGTFTLLMKKTETIKLLNFLNNYMIQ